MAKLWQKRNHLSIENKLFVTCNATRRINKITHIKKKEAICKTSERNNKHYATMVSTYSHFFYTWMLHRTKRSDARIEC